MSRQAVKLLEVLLSKPREWRYGYDLLGETTFGAGTLYPLLARLARLSWLETKWQDAPEPGRPPRHLYRLTATGIKGARESLARAAERGWATRLQTDSYRSK